MSLTVGPNLSTFYGSGASGSALTGRGTAAGRQSALSSRTTEQTNQTSQTDQINITSITVNITQQTSGSGDGQLRLGVDKVDPAGDGGGAVLQALRGRLFFEPDQFCADRHRRDDLAAGDVGSQHYAADPKRATTDSTEATNQQTPGGADSNVTASQRAAPSGGSYRSVDISI